MGSEGGNFSMASVALELQKMNENLMKEANENKDLKQKLLADSKEVKEKIDKILVEVDGTKLGIQENKQRIDRLEDEKRRRNIIIFGIAETEQEQKELLESKVFEVLRGIMKSTITSEEIDFITRMGPKDNKRTKPRGVLVMLTTLRRKINLMSLKIKLRDTDFYLAEHFSQEIVNKRKPLLEEAKKLRKEGKYAVVKYDKLVCTERSTQHAPKAIATFKLQGEGSQSTSSYKRSEKRKPVEGISPEMEVNNKLGKNEMNSKKKTRKNNKDETIYFTDSEEFSEGSKMDVSRDNSNNEEEESQENENLNNPVMPQDEVSEN